MASFGEQLRQAREAKQITLQEISAATKISRRSLRALEEDQFDLLPGGIFNKGFVRAYARYVGLDEEKTVEQYLAASGTEERPIEELQPPEPTAEAGAKGLAMLERLLKSRALSGIVVIRVLAVIVALALGWLWWSEHQREKQSQPPAQTVEAPAGTPASAPAEGSPKELAASAPANSAAEAKPAAESKPSKEAAAPAEPKPAPEARPNSTPDSAAASQEQAKPATEQPQPAADQAQSEAEQAADEAMAVQVTISATQKSWVRVYSDKKEVETIIMDPDKPSTSYRTYSARNRLKVVAGYPEGLTVTYNGKPAGELGRDGQPLTLIFTPKGMRTYLAKGP